MIPKERECTLEQVKGHTETAHSECKRVGLEVLTFWHMPSQEFTFISLPCFRFTLSHPFLEINLQKTNLFNTQGLSVGAPTPRALDLGV